MELDELFDAIEDNDKELLRKVNSRAIYSLDDLKRYHALVKARLEEDQATNEYTSGEILDSLPYSFIEEEEIENMREELLNNLRWHSSESAYNSLEPIVNRIFIKYRGKMKSPEDCIKNSTQEDEQQIRGN